ncbi:hypothetical protein VSR17_15330 [Cupriavidus taiwanensis]|uniref:hypothetical protein n=1 Tax=Cupriavidus taiwanensis TaxID=164546 RepID=UPI003177D916
MKADTSNPAERGVHRGDQPSWGGKRVTASVTVREYARLTTAHLAETSLDRAQISVSAFEWLCRMNAEITHEVRQVVEVAERSFQVSVIYENGKRASRALLFEEKGRFVCTGSHGKIIWGGASKGGRSEFGPNTTDSMAMLYLDDQGNLVSEDSMQIHMSLQLGGIPTGTAKHFSKYRFKRVPE